MDLGAQARRCVFGLSEPFSEISDEDFDMWELRRATGVGLGTHKALESGLRAPTCVTVGKGHIFPEPLFLHL